MPLPATLDGKSSLFVNARTILSILKARHIPAVRYHLRPDPPGFSEPTAVQPARQNPAQLYFFVT